MGPSPKDVTQMLIDWSNGNQQVLAELIPVVYDELRKLADGHLRRHRPDNTLQATALVHEAYVRLVDQTHPLCQNRAQFFGIAANLIRQIIVDHARTHLAAKRGRGERALALDDVAELSEERAADLVVLNDALTRLAAIDPQQSRVVELRFFGGLTVEETAEVLRVSARTVKREWRIARAWLQRELERGGLR